MMGMLKHTQRILASYQYRIAATLVVVSVLGAGMVSAHFETTPVGSPLVLFGWLGAMLGLYVCASLRTQLRLQIFHLVPGYARQHIAVALGLMLVVVGACVAGSSITGTGELWASASYLRMFALLWAWALAWACLGCLIRTAIVVGPLIMHLPVMPALAVRLEPVLWNLIQRPSAAETFLLLAAAAGLNGLFAYLVSRRSSHDGVAKGNFSGDSRARLFRGNPGLVGQGLTSRIRHMELGLKPDPWIIVLAIMPAVLSWFRGDTLLSSSDKIYAFCFLFCSFIGGPDVFRRDRLAPLFRLPLSRTDLVRSYGLAFLVACIRRWFWFVLITYAAFLVLLLKTGAQPPTLEVWIYCLGILFVMFGIRALLGSWDDWLPLRIGAIALLVSYGSFSDVIPFVTPITTLLIGLTLIGAAYYRWCNLELD
jgi:hypothetical protein